MCRPQTCQTRRLVTAPTLQSDEPVLDDVDPAHPVPSRDLVCRQEQFHAVRNGLLAILCDQLHRNALLEEQGEILGRVRRSGRVGR